MLRQVRYFFIVVLGLSIAPLAAGDASEVKDVWFENIKRPMALSSEQGEAMCADLFRRLKAGEDTEKIVAAMPKDDSPRVVFLTLGDGIFPGRTYYAAGYSFSEALNNVITIMRLQEKEYPKMIEGKIEEKKKQLKTEALLTAEQKKQSKVSVEYSPELREKMKDPGKWINLRVDIVQSVAVGQMAIGATKLFMSNMIGIAFDVNSSFAFTPEQLTGRFLISSEHLLMPENVMNFISDSSNVIAMRLWLDMATTSMPFRVTLFESDSYFVDENGARRMFRGHPAEENFAPENMPNPLDAAVDLCGMIVSTLTKNGQLTLPFPEWVPERPDGKVAIPLRAETALALTRTAVATGKKELLESATLAIAPVLKAVKKSSKIDENARVVVTLDELPEGETMRIAREVVRLDDTALACLAMIELQNAYGDMRYQDQIDGVINYLMSCQKADGSFFNFRYYSDMESPLVEPISEFSKLEGLALTGMVFCHYAQMNKEKKESMMVRTDIVWRQLLDKIAIIAYPKEQHFSPWIIEFMQGYVSPTQQNMGIVGKFAIQASRGIDTAPLLPDMFGAPSEIPSMTIAARRLRFIAGFCHWLKFFGREEADMLAEDAWPLWCFQQQAIMEPAVASSLPNPGRYIGWYRDNLDDFGFDFRGQVDQIFSMLALHGYLKAAGRGDKYLPSDEMKALWCKNWQRIDQHPMCVSPKLLLTDKKAAGEKIKFSGEINLMPPPSETTKQ